MARIDQVAGIGHKDATKLRKAGIRTSKSLIERATPGRGRSDVSLATGIESKELQLWVNHADLLRVRGVGAEYAELRSQFQPGGGFLSPNRTQNLDYQCPWAGHRPGTRPRA